MYKVTLSACGNIDHDENPYDNIVDGIRIDAQIAESGKKGNIRLGIVDQAQMIRTQIPGSQNADQKDKNLPAHLSADNPAHIFDRFILQYSSNHRQAPQWDY